MKNLLFASFLLFFQIPIFAQINVTQLEKYIDSCRTEWNIPGMAVAIIKNDSVLFNKGFGVENIETNIPVTSKTMFGIASLSKAFTSLALGQLVDKKIISWKDKVTQFHPNFKMYDPWVTNEMNISDLLSHRSGFTTFSGDLLWHSTIFSRKEIIERIQYLKPTYPFRAGYGYSNVLFLTAGEIIPKVTEDTYDSYLKKNIFEPLGMNNTNTSISEAKKYSSVAQPHIIDNGKVKKIKYISWDNIAPAGGINSTSDDMTHWIKMLLNNGKYNNKILISEKTLQEIWSPENIQTIGKFDNYLFPSMHFHTYGKGWDMFDYHGRKIINHSGGLDGMVLHLCIVPEEKLGFVILTNSSNYLPWALMYRILDEVFNEKGKDYPRILLGYSKKRDENDAKAVIEEEKNRNKESKPSLSLEKYCGKYCGDLYGCATISMENNKLKLQFEPAPEFNSALEHWQYNTFSVKFNEFPSLPRGKVNFIINQDGNVDEFTIDVPNPDFDFTELEFKRTEEHAH